MKEMEETTEEGMEDEGTRRRNGRKERGGRRELKMEWKKRKGRMKKKVIIK